MIYSQAMVAVELIVLRTVVVNERKLSDDSAEARLAFSEFVPKRNFFCNFPRASTPSTYWSDPKKSPFIKENHGMFFY